MKYIVLDMTRFNSIYCVFFCFSLGVQGQIKYEREHRIRKDQFPKAALNLIETKTKGAKRLKFYQEIDSIRVSYEAKFKKDKLWYSVEFSDLGVLEDIEITIEPVDVANETFKAINNFLKAQFISYKINKIQQQYVFKDDEDKIFKDAFQNLMLPYVNYEIICSGKKEEGYEDFEILFDSDGNFKSIRKSLPPNYDHVLY